MKLEIKHVSPIAVISRTDRLTIPQIPAHSGPAIDSLIQALKQQGIPPLNGECIYLYHGCDGNPTVPFDLEICLPVPPGLRANFAAPFRLTETSPFKCVYTEYVGSMVGIGPAWQQMVQTLLAQGHRPTSESREVYKRWVCFDSAENITELQQGIV